MGKDTLPEKTGARNLFEKNANLNEFITFVSRSALNHTRCLLFCRIFSMSATPLPQTAIPKNDPRTITGWALFDWANSAYALVITVAIFPPYFLANTPDTIRIQGAEIRNETLESWCISLAYLLVALVSPMLSGIADYGGKKKRFMFVFTLIGALSCMSLYFFTGPETMWRGVWGFIMATMGFAGGLVFYNAYLPEIATEDRYDAVSAKGFIYGFIGSVLLLTINLFMVKKYQLFGFESVGDALRIAFVTVGIWWLVFAQYAFWRLPADRPGKLPLNVFGVGYKELRGAFNTLIRSKNTRRFLITFFCYNAAVQAILFLASSFAKDEIGMEDSLLIVLVLILQLVAVLGAWLASKLSEWKGNKVSIYTMLVIWAAVCGFGYFVTTNNEVFMLGSAIGLVMGGIQAMSRSTYAKFLPEDTKDTTSYFSFFDVMDKLSTVFGTLVFGLVAQLSGGMRGSLVALGVMFAISLCLFYFVSIKKMKREEV